MTKKLQGLYKGNVGSMLGNIYLNPERKSVKRYKKIVEVRPGKLKDDYSDILGKDYSQSDKIKDEAPDLLVDSICFEHRNDIQDNDIITINDRLCMITEMRDNEDRVVGEQTSIKEGFVYLVKNNVYPGWVKAGMTIDYEDRLNTYNLCSPVEKFYMISIRWVANRRLCETILLEELGKVASRTSGEWFKIDDAVALKIFNS